MNRLRAIAGYVLFAAALAGAALWVEHKPAVAIGSSPWRDGYVPNVKVTAQNGKTYAFYEDLLKGKTAVINFIFTGCSQLCPLTTARLAAVQDELKAQPGSNVFFYSISLDPLGDTPEKLKTFADGYKAGPNWLFLTGDPEDLKLLRSRLGERSRDKSEHQALLIFANDNTGEWGKDSAMSDTEHIVATIRDLDPAWRDQIREISNAADPNQLIAFQNTPGEALFLRACASCHTVGEGDKIGPDLSGLHQRRDRQWLLKFVSRPDKMREDRDPVALQLFEKYNRVAMPYLGLSEVDVNDVLSYIETATHQKKADAALPENPAIKSE